MFVEHHPADGGKPRQPVTFQQFAELMAYVRAFKRTHSDDVLRVHIPVSANATTEQLQELDSLGVQRF
jgi:hypothetical protein